MKKKKKLGAQATEEEEEIKANDNKKSNLSKTNGVFEDAFNLKLFPFSLGDKAHQWEKTLPSDSITTWDDCKRAFLDKFFSAYRTAKIRNEISTFQQKNLESFSEAWERFKGYWSQCPHHGFTKENLLSTFYRGALPEYRTRLDTASNGFFLGITEEDAEELVDNMVKSDSIYSGEHDRANRSDDQHTRKEIKSLQEKLDMLIKEKAKHGQLNSVVDQKQKQHVGIMEVDGLESQEELCLINSNGTWYRKEPNFQYQNNYQQRPHYNNQQGGYQATQSYPLGFSNQSNQSTQAQGSSSQAPASDSSVDSMFKKLLEFQARNEKTMVYEFKNIHTKIDGNYSDLNNKFLQLASRFNTLESQVASMPSSSKSSMGSLPGKPEKNPKESCNVIISTTSSEIELSDYDKKVDEIEKLVFGNSLRKVEKLVVATAEAQMVDKAMERVQVQAERKDEATNLQRAEPRAEKPVERRADQKLKEVKKEDTEIELSPYDKLPFPQRVLIKAQKKVLSKFRKDLSDVGVRLPEISGMREAHVQMMLIKDILDHQAEVAELLDISILKIDPPVPPQSLPKLESQGKFTLSCSLGKITVNDALVDSGASVNMISLEMVKSLGIESMEPNTSSLMFGDSSSTTPIGLIKDFPLKIGACTIPIDLTVLKMAIEKRVPLILGTPFLTTVGTCIDFPNKKVTLLNTQAKVAIPEKEDLVGESSKKMCDEHLESAKKEEVSRATKAAHDKKKIVKEPHPQPLDKTLHTLTLHPMKLKDGAIEYKIKCKGHHHSSASKRPHQAPRAPLSSPHHHS
ncbi:uncharacterized protein LOC130495687 [Raphanus sativus]|uniref:Uncharacterized protein LOC130495687 n=1 Tax=Raphanus sativus TaxID=3726 RepID=A0A9W3BV10_RAPSA|nr:uncharacterized protein LOC130495687 [Raphanus sativus]